jgi:4-hydroxybenzoate polyprenyltransferase
VTALILVAAGLIGAAQISTGFLGGVLGYLGVTIGYSLRFKRIALLDVTVIGLLFSLRVVMGMVAIGQSLAPWLLAFSILFFCSLALAKRHGEIMKARLGSVTSIAKRGYRVEDWTLTLAFGVAASLGAIIIMLLYIRLEATQNGLYHHPDWLFIPPVCVLVWVQRVWLLSNRAEMHDDPVAFALTDRGSWYLLAGIAASVALAQ